MKNYLIFLFVIALLFALYTPVAYADGISLPEYINVGLKYGENAVSSATVSANGFAVNDIYGSPLISADGSAELTVTLQNGGISIYKNGQQLLSYSDGIIIEPLSGFISLDGTRYRGSLRFDVVNSALRVINKVTMDDYLCGVVPKEIGGNSPLEALKAQAVSARSYTARFIGKHADDGFDICTAVHCQVYGGTDAETPAANSAVYETSGIIAMYGDKIAELYYFASDGGATESVENVWGSTLHPYLKGVDDPYETDSATHHTWSVTLTKAEVNEIFAAYDLGDITDISVEETSQKGAATKLKVTGTKDSRIFEKEKCRTVFGGKVYSQAYTITKNYAGNNGPAAVGAEGTINLPSTIYVMGKDGVVQKKIEDIVVISAAGISKLQQGGEVISYTIDGRGWGHLIGMSQWGAIEMANQGFTYEDILNHYYTGIELIDVKGITE